MAKKKYKVLKGKEQANVNSVILSNATQAQLKHFFHIGHPYILLDNEQETTTDKQNKTDKPEQEA